MLGRMLASSSERETRPADCTTLPNLSYFSGSCLKYNAFFFFLFSSQIGEIPVVFPPLQISGLSSVRPVLSALAKWLVIGVCPF